jgi:hypothetical protein
LANTWNLETGSIPSMTRATIGRVRFSGGRAGVGAGHATSSMGDADEKPRRAGRRDVAGAVAGLVRQRGTLDVLRHGVELLGLRQPLKLAEFKPALGINAEILARYAANRLRTVRQVAPRDSSQP